MRLWKSSYGLSTPIGLASAASVVTHAVVIGAWVIATLPASSLPPDSLTNRVYFIPPIEKPMVPRATREVVHYLSLTPGPGFGPGLSDIDARRPGTELVSRSPRGGERADSAAPPPTPPVLGDPAGDSVFTEVEVDSVVVRSANSAAPAYPVALLSKRIEGIVLARYVVDTTGFADTTSFEIVRATNPEFVRAVRDALPHMRFSPAKIGAQRVRQLVEQPFAFRIGSTLDAAKP